MKVSSAVRMITHYKCRNGLYPRSLGVIRFPVPDDKVSWNVDWSQYSPIEHDDKSIIGKPWSDPMVESDGFRPDWNNLDGKVDRRSHFTKYLISNGRPMNPVGRTGVSGRGCLGRWGPNHAADPIVTRWKRNESNAVECDESTLKPVLQCVLIERRDSREWAIPGGMVDPGEQVSSTLKREFMEEALNALEADSIRRNRMEDSIKNFFENGVEVYRGYVDDPRNTDNAWMETVAVNFHDEDGGVVGKLHLTAGDDAANVKWMDVSSALNLYASHVDLIRAVARMRNSFW